MQGASIERRSCVDLVLFLGSLMSVILSPSVFFAVFTNSLENKMKPGQNVYHIY